MSYINFTSSASLSLKLFIALSVYDDSWHELSFPFSHFGYDDQRLGLKRLRDISMGVITPLSEQLIKPLPNAMVLVNLKELSTGAYKFLPQGATQPEFFFIILNKLHRPPLRFDEIAQTFFLVLKITLKQVKGGPMWLCQLKFKVRKVHAILFKSKCVIYSSK